MSWYYEELEDLINIWILLERKEKRRSCLELVQKGGVLSPISSSLKFFWTCLNYIRAYVEFLISWRSSLTTCLLERKTDQSIGSLHTWQPNGINTNKHKNKEIQRLNIMQKLNMLGKTISITNKVRLWLTSHNKKIKWICHKRDIDYPNKER